MAMASMINGIRNAMNVLRCIRPDLSESVVWDIRAENFSDGGRTALKNQGSSSTMAMACSIIF